ncbi:unnamed protein product [Parnassius apollo]|uniref:(apollo) hypothetical protein n=1 Tax=Parnassius apollo TaxID=110799 RepID=A0A8S3WUW2_PARAO|nr:unnamed protein product [Parnassius apollo]
MILTGKVQSNITSVAESVVMELIDGLLDEGRVLYTDNCTKYQCTSSGLTVAAQKDALSGHSSIEPETSASRCDCCQNKKGDIAAQETSDGMVVLKRRDKRIVSALSTKHSELKTVAKKKLARIKLP